MQNLLKYFIFLLLIPCYKIYANPATSNQIKPIKFRIVIINYYMGRKQYVTTVTQDSLYTVHNFPDSNIESDARLLTKTESERLCRYFAKFPLSSLKDEYTTMVEDGTQIDFLITINDKYRKVYISNFYQYTLGEMVANIVKLLKADYIQYNKKAVPWDK
jgi:hypothetical protein